MDPSKLLPLAPYVLSPVITELQKIWNGEDELEKLQIACCKTEDVLNLWEVNRGSPRLDNLLEDLFQELEGYFYDTEDLVDRLLLSSTSTTRGIKGKIRDFSDLLKRLLKTPHDIVQLRENMERVCNSIKEASGTEQNNSKPLHQEAPSDPRSPLSDNLDFISGTSRDQDKKTIIEELMQSDRSGVSIVGIDGLGKTALARTIMADEAIKRHFPLILPVSVSGDFQLASIEQKLLASYSETSIDAAESHRGDRKFLQDHLCSYKGRVLIILDDLWSVTDEDWQCFQSNYLKSGSGWKILITTPCRVVAEKTKSIAYGLSIMKDEECKKLIMAKGIPSEFECDIDIIAKKCQGLPIIANKIGLELSRNQDVQDKKGRIGILNNCNSLWELEEYKKVFLSLNSRKSKQSLDLKRCFCYCSLFPPEHEFTKEDLVQLWEVEGFIKPQEKILQKATARMKCFGEMSSSYIPRPLESRDNQQPVYKMLEFKYRFAQHLASRAFCRVDKGTSNFLSSSKNIPHLSRVKDNLQNIRHLSLANLQNIDKSLLMKIASCKGLRTFLLLHQNHYQVPISRNFFEKLVKLRSLRLLDLSLTNISILPNPKDLSKHLRYLDLSYTEVEKLPKQIQCLCALQVLKLKNCKLRELPKELNQLINLTHLHVTVKKVCLPLDMGKLTNLEVFDSFSVGRKDGYKVRELSCMQNLIEVHIFRLDNIINMVEAKEAGLIEKQWLQTLVLEWENANTANAEDVLEGLQPHKNLNVLRVRNYGGKLFPTWLTSRECQLVSINLDDCPNCEVLPTLGQLPMLKNLVLRSIHKVITLDDLFCGQSKRVFPYLEFLEFHEMEGLTNWTRLKVGDMPCLRALKIFGCKVLISLPSFTHLSCLMNLEINNCPLLEELPELPSSLNGKSGKLIIRDSSLVEERCQDGKADWPKIKGIPYVEINGTMIQTESYRQYPTNHKDKVSKNEQPATLAMPVKENNISQVYRDEEVPRSQECRTKLPRLGDETYTSKSSSIIGEMSYMKAPAQTETSAFLVKRSRENQIGGEAKFCEKCNLTNHNKKQCQSHLKCTICNNNGHTIDYCRKRKRSMDNGEASSSINQSDSKSTYSLLSPLVAMFENINLKELALQRPLQSTETTQYTSANHVDNHPNHDHFAGHSHGENNWDGL